MIARTLDWPPVWTLLHMLLAWTLSLFWAPLNVEARIIGLFVIAVSLGLMGWAAVTIWRAGSTLIPGEEPSALLTGGPFRISRNPIYLADLGILGGFSLAIAQPLGLVLIWPLKKVLDIRFVEPEERILENRFGEAYMQYRKDIPRWL
jgi:protein-S-isoprenylcysteine O-methyltransferase Ste14